MRPVDRLDFGVAAAGLFATAAAWLAGPHLEPWFARFFGPAPPALCIAALGVVALLLAPFLERRSWWGVPRVHAAFTASWLVTGFGAFIIAVDRLVGFPQDINAPLPWALLYYPAMGFAAEVALRLVPLAALVWLAPVFAQARPWVVMGIASVPEAALQASSGEAVVAGLVALHLLGFGTAELYLLRRFGFLAMYGFRMTYYLVWHILWGALRMS